MNGCCAVLCCYRLKPKSRLSNTLERMDYRDDGGDCGQRHRRTRRKLKFLFCSDDWNSQTSRRKTNKRKKTRRLCSFLADSVRFCLFYWWRVSCFNQISREKVRNDGEIDR
mmetsp:Transcript_26540/g.54772  ORF Transcript_26540/g.54772 Transcript_26540/m.54772 type:complete len:111 (-) Transcript_26540:11-343(-)